MGTDVPTEETRFSGAPRPLSRPVCRERLHRILDDSAPLTVVRGPAGSGKTVLVREWLTASGARLAGTTVGWITVDDSSSSRTSLWQTAIAVLLEVTQSDDHVVAFQAAARALQAGGDPRSIFSGVMRAIDHDVLLVFDQSEALQDLVALEDLLRIVQSVPGVKMIVLTRSVGFFENPLVRAQVDPTLITANQLAFSETEIAELSASLDMTATPVAIQSILELSHGNPLIAHALLLSMSSTAIGESPADLRWRLEKALEDYLVASFLNDAEKDGQLDFYRAIAIVPSVTVSLALKLTATEPLPLLNRAFENGLGTWQPSDGEEHFSLEPTLRRVLERDLRTVEPHTILGLRRKLAAWARDNGDPLLALENALEIGDFDLADTVLRQSWWDLIRFHRAPVRKLLRALPLRVHQKRPLLAMLLALIYNTDGGHRLRALEYFAIAASSRVSKQPQALTDQFILRGVESAALRVTGLVRPARSAAESSMRAFEKLDPAQLDEISRLAPTLLNHNGTTFFYSGETQAARATFEVAHALAVDASPTADLQAMSSLAGLQAISGNMREADSWVAQVAAQTWPDGQIDGYSGSLFQIARAFLALEQFSLDQTTTHVASLNKHRSTIEHWTLLEHLDAMVGIAMGEALSAGAKLEATVASKKGKSALSDFTAQRLAITRSLLAVAAGEIVRAEELLRKYESTDPQIAIALARIKLVSDRPEESLRILQKAQPSARVLSPRSASELMILEAATHSRLGDSASALHHLERGAALMHTHGLRSALMLIPTRDLESLRALAAVQASESTRALLEPEVPPAFVGIATAAATDMTPREIAVLQELEAHSRVKDLADALFVSPNTVKSQLRSAYRKLGVSTRTDALAASHRLGILRRDYDDAR